MAILLPPEPRLLCQGMTGRAGTYHTQRMIAYGTNVVGGVTPGKGGRRHLDLPVFGSIGEAVTETGANASMMFVPPANAAKAMIEGIENELALVVVLTERVPVLDMVRVRDALMGSKTLLVGPNSQGILAPASRTMIGVMTTVHSRSGCIGIASRSASLTSEIVAQTSALGLGQSTTVGVGGDPVHGLGLVECVKLFLDDPETKGIILIGEIGGSEEQDAAAYIAKARPAKPIVALIAGRHAPPEQRMGHAGTLTMLGAGGADEKISALKAAGVAIAPNAHLVGETMQRALRI